MPDEPNGQDLIETFLKAARLRLLDQCQQIYQVLNTLSKAQPRFKPWCRYMQGSLAFQRHRWTEAERIFADLLQTELELTLRGHVLYAYGRSYDAQGRWDAAIDVFEQSLAAFTQLEEVIEQARARKHIAITLHKGFTQGDFASAVLTQAIAHCQSALAALASIEDPSSDVKWLEGTIWNTLGIIRMNQSQWDEAIACYQQEQAILQALGDRFGIGLAYGNLGEVYQKRGQDHWPEALTAYQQALDIIREFDDRYEETEALANLAFLHQEKGDHQQALDYYGQAIRTIEDLRAGVSSEAAQAGFFATVVDTYVNAVLLSVKTEQYTQAFDLVERARSRAFLDVLATRSPDLSQQMEARPLTLAEVQAILPPDTLLLEYFTTGLAEVRLDRKASQAGVHRHRFPPAETLLFAVTRDRIEIHNVNLLPDTISPRQLEKVVEEHFLEPEIQRLLYDKLIVPVEKLIQGKRRLYLVPHGPLHYIPFQALLASDGETLLRARGPQLVFAPSATLLCRKRHPKRKRKPTASCLAVGYNSEGKTELYFAEDEARQIAQLTHGQAIVGSSPKKVVLYQLASDYRMLHFACHGEFKPESPLASFLHLAPDEKLTALDILTHLRLRCDLVTLSACESGLSRVRRGDELMGLVRAFMYAGTPALVSTLWQVDDRSTRLLMEKFYQAIQTGLDFAEALKQAQLFVKNLTYEDALNVLTPIIEDELNRMDTAPVENRKSPSGPPLSELALSQARTYLRGAANSCKTASDEMSLSEGENGKTFANPRYWAAFVLFGPYDI